MEALVAAALAAALAAAPAAGPPAPAEPPAAEFRLQDLDGRTVTLSSLAGQAVGVHFFAVWCEPCIQQLTEIEQAAARYGGRGYRPLLIAVPHREDAARLREFAKGRGLEIPLLLDADGSVQRAYGISGLPHNVLIGRDGAVRYRGSALPSPFSEEIGRLVAEKMR